MTRLLQDLFRGQKRVPRHHQWLTAQTRDYPISQAAGRTVWTDSKSLCLHTHSFLTNKEISQTNISNKIAWYKHIQAHIHTRIIRRALSPQGTCRWELLVRDGQNTRPICQLLAANSSRIFCPSSLKLKKLKSIDCSYRESLTQSLAMQ